MAVGAFPTKGKIVVVPGGGSGIGLAYVEAAVKAGAKAVIIADLRLTKEAKQVVTSTKEVTFQECDMTKWKDLQNLIDVSLKEYGDVPDIYAVAAGVFEPPFSNFWDDPESLDTNGYAHIDINVNGPIKLTRLAIRASLGKGKNTVVLIVGSIAGYSKQYVAPIYSASKHALIGFVRSMGDAEAIQGVKVVAVCPGIVATPIWTTGTPGSGKRFEINDDMSISADAVAAVMLDAIESEKYAGGSIVEVSKLGTRVIPEWNIDPPGMVDGEMAKGTDVSPEAIQKALKPILAVTAQEKGNLAN